MGKVAGTTASAEMQNRQLAREGHTPGKKIVYGSAAYLVMKTGAWVRVTERKVSRVGHNNSARRRLAKGK